MTWESVIGLEVHVQLNTQSKIFSGSSTRFGAAANSQASLIDLGMPGVLPVLNAEAVRAAIRFGLGIQAQINHRSIFERKNYFYPDLPKGYQISQAEIPIIGAGHLDIQVGDAIKRIRITRAHLEEDAGKSLHQDFGGMTGIDLNRAGTPLLEIVSEPDLRSAKEAVAYLRGIHALIRYLDISDGRMAEGSMRCDCNVSVRPAGNTQLGTRCEIKNVNSFKFVEKAIQYEIERQIDILEGGGRIKQETRLYDAERNETRSMRSKEDANDYRYFPDPDLLPVQVTQEMIDREKSTLPELPEARAERYILSYSLSPYDARVLVSSRELAEYFETVVRCGGPAKMAANWIMGELMAALNRDELEISEAPITPEQLAGLLVRIADQTLSGKLAKQVFGILWAKEGDSADAIIEARGLRQEQDTGLIQGLVEQILTEFPEQVQAYRGGKEKLFGFFVGEVMKRSRGKAAPAMVNAVLLEKLQKQGD